MATVRRTKLSESRPRVEKSLCVEAFLVGGEKTKKQKKLWDVKTEANGTHQQNVESLENPELRHCNGGHFSGGVARGD